MFVNDFCEDWDSSKNQDNFIRTYFRKGKVSSTKASNILKSVDKARNTDAKKSTTKLVKQNSECNYESSPNSHANKHSSDYQGEFNKKRRKKEIFLHDSSQQNCSTVHSQSENMQLVESCNAELNRLKKKKKRKSLTQNKSISYQSSEQTNNTEDSHSKTKIIFDNFSTDSIKSVDLQKSEPDSNFLKLKKKKKRLRNKARTVSEEKSSISEKIPDETGTTRDAVSDESLTMESHLSGNNFDSNCLKIKKRKKKMNFSKSDKISNEAEPNNIEDSRDLSLKNGGNLFQSKAYKKLQAAKFRYLNEMLYTNSGKDALSYFQENTDEYVDYHEGYESQVSKWPINPVDIIIQEICRMNKQAVIADLGCGKAKIAEVFPNRTVYSFDLIALKDCVTACDMANVPLPSSSVDIVVFCLSLMGTNWKDYLKEGHRILKLGGTLKIAEIESRIENLQHFIKEIENVGFSLINQNLSHKMFIFLNFKRINRNKKSSKLPAVALKPCLYKKR